MNSVLLQGRILFDKGSHKEASFEYIKADQMQDGYAGDDKESIVRDITVGMNKCKLELGNKTSVGNINEAALLDESNGVATSGQSGQAAIDLKYDWYQNVTHAFISYKIRRGGAQLKDGGL